MYPAFRNRPLSSVLCHRCCVCDVPLFDKYDGEPYYKLCCGGECADSHYYENDNYTDDGYDTQQEYTDDEN